MSDRPQFQSARGMRFYLAGRYDRRAELFDAAHFLECFGHRSTARWLTGAHEKPEGGDDALYTPEELAMFAAQDTEDIETSDLLISFTETPDVGYTSGGRMVEFGYALALGLDIAIIGPRENVFMQAPTIRQAPTLQEFIAHYGSAFAWVTRRGGSDLPQLPY